MAVQNRRALDMLLAEKGGVSSMFGDMCCIFIPNNTATDGSVTKALEGLWTLSKKMAENSGIDSPFNDWMIRMFGQMENFYYCSADFYCVIFGCLTYLWLLLCSVYPCVRSLCTLHFLHCLERLCWQDRSFDTSPASGLMSSRPG